MLEYFQKASRDVEGMKVVNAVVEEVDNYPILGWDWVKERAEMFF